MELRYRREAVVGLLIVISAVLFAWLMLWLRGKTWREGAVVQVAFDDVAGLKEGDPVLTSGVTVGQVRRVRLDTAGVVTVEFGLRRAPMPREDASVTIRAKDFFGARYLDYQPGRSARPLDISRPMRGSRATDLGDLAAGLVEPTRELLGNVGELVAPTTGRELRAVLVEARRTLEALGRAGEAPSRELAGAMTELRRVFQRLDRLLAANTETTTESVRNLRDLSGNLALATATLSRTTSTLDSLLARVNRGDGTVGALLNDSTFYHELRRTNTALGDLLIDLKANPGRYFRLRL
jgi:phospholipid/cholesterol/gamma-HCH transport system substrate-binding protein